jgi:hypothetical protein
LRTIALLASELHKKKVKPKMLKFTTEYGYVLLSTLYALAWYGFDKDLICLATAYVYATMSQKH